MYKCKYCDRKFEKKKSLTNHTRWHKLKRYEEFQNRCKKNISKINLGNNNGNWKGNKVGYVSLHQWVSGKKTKPKLCKFCKKKPPIDLASKSHKYLRDVNDWVWLCRGCHMKYDYKKGFRRYKTIK